MSASDNISASEMSRLATVRNNNSRRSAELRTLSILSILFLNGDSLFSLQTVKFDVFQEGLMRRINSNHKSIKAIEEAKSYDVTM